MLLRLGTNIGTRSISHIPRAAPKSASAPARRVSDSNFIVCPTHFANSRARTLDVFPAVLGDTLLQFERFYGGRMAKDARSRLSATIVAEALPGLDNFRRSIGLDRSSIADNKEFVEGFKQCADRNVKDFCRSLSDLGVEASVSHSDSREHKANRNDIWNALISDSHIFRGHYDGWFSWTTESFIATDGGLQEIVLEGKKEIKLLTTASGTSVTKTKQVAFIFRLSKFRERILKWLLDNPDVITPKSAQASLLSFLSSTTSLPDIPFTLPRSRFPPGPQVPQDPKHVFSPPFDAFCLYISSSLGTHWPPDVQIIAGDSLEAHASWLGMLFALGLPLPRRIWVLPNVSRIGDGGVDARDLVKRAGKDAVRFYLASSATSKAENVELSHAGLVECYEGLRTLVNGLIDDLVRYSYGMEGIPLEPGYFTVADAPLESMLSELPHLFARRLLDDLDPSGAISSALLLLTSTRSHLVSSFGKSSSRAPERTAALVQLAVESLRVVTILLDSSVVPGMFEGLLERLGVGKDERTWNHVLAKRIGVAGELIRMDLETMKVEALRETIPWTEDEVD